MVVDYSKSVDVMVVIAAVGAFAGVCSGLYHRSRGRRGHAKRPERQNFFRGLGAIAIAFTILSTWIDYDKVHMGLQGVIVGLVFGGIKVAVTALAFWIVRRVVSGGMDYSPVPAPPSIALRERQEPRIGL
jgi:hypothetical protein